MSYQRIDSGESGYYAGQLTNASKVALTGAQVTDCRLTLTDAATGTIIRNNQDVIGGGATGASVNSSGNLIWNIQQSDTDFVTAGSDWEEHAAEIVWQYSGGYGRQVHRIYCARLRGLCTEDEVIAQLKTDESKLTDANLLLISLCVDAASSRLESDAKRTLRRAEVTERHSVRANTGSVFVRRWPIESVAHVAEDLEGVFPTDSRFDATEYAIVGGPGASKGEVALRVLRFLGGVDSVEIKYTGGLRDVASVPAHVRFEAARQAAFWFQRAGGQIGVSSTSVGGANVAIETLASNDLLPGFKKAIASMKRPVL